MANIYQSPIQRQVIESFSKRLIEVLSINERQTKSFIIIITMIFTLIDLIILISYH